MILHRKELSYVRLFVNLDVSSFDMKICILNGEIEKLDSYSVNNNLPGTTAFGNAMMELFLEKFSLEELATMPLEEHAEFLQIKGKNRVGDPKCVASTIQKAVRSSYRLDKVEEDSNDVLLGTSIAVIRTYQQQIKELEKSIGQSVISPLNASIPNLLEISKDQ